MAVPDAFEREVRRLERAIQRDLDTRVSGALAASTTCSEPLTFEDIRRTLDELDKLPAPPKLTARPEFVGLLLSRLEAARVKVEGPVLLPRMLGDVEIRESEHLPVRWLWDYDGHFTFETLDGRVLKTTERLPDPLEFDPKGIVFEPPEPPEPTEFWLGTGLFLRSQGIPFPVLPPWLPYVAIEGESKPQSRRKRRSKGWRRHVRRVKAEKRRERG